MTPSVAPVRIESVRVQNYRALRDVKLKNLTPLTVPLGTDGSQLLVTTHSPFFVDTLRPKELWVLYRGKDGYTQARQAADVGRVQAMVQEGGQLDHLWMEGRLRGRRPTGGRREEPELTVHLEELVEVLVEELSAEEVLRAVLPRMVGAETRILVLIDEDRQDCRRLKRVLEEAAGRAGLRTKSVTAPDEPFFQAFRTGLLASAGVV